MPDIDVEINGRTYRLACAEGEERRVTESARRLDAYARQVSAQAGGFSEMRVLVMAGLMAVDALAEVEGAERGAGKAATRSKDGKDAKNGEAGAKNGATGHAA